MARKKRKTDKSILRRHARARATSLLPTRRVDTVLNIGEARRIPKVIFWRELQSRESAERCELLDNTLNDVEIWKRLEWDAKQVADFRSHVTELCLKEPDGFRVAVFSQQFHESLWSDERTELYATSIYWNEIDQYIFEYRSETARLFASRVCRLLLDFHDRISCVSSARLLLEIALNAVANQWVLTSTYNQFRRFITNGHLPVGCKELDEFSLSLTNWSRKNKKQLSEIVGLAIPDHPGYFTTEYEPTTHQQVSIAQFVAERVDELAVFETPCTPIVKELSSLYRYLCKFVHPTAQLFPPHPQCGFTDADVDLSVELCALRIVDASSALLEVLFLSEVFCSMRFQDLFEHAVSRSRRLSPTFVTDPLISDVMKKYKEIVVNTTAGDMIVHRVDTISASARKFAADYDRLNDQQRESIGRYLKELLAKKNG